MGEQTIFPFELGNTSENLTAHGGLALIAEFNHGLGLRELSDRYLPEPGSNRGFAPSVFVDSLVLLLQGGGSSLEDLRELEQEAGLMHLLGRELIPAADTVGDWLRRMGDGGTGQLGLAGLDRVRTVLNQRLLRRDPYAAYTLDVDAFEIIGEKETAAFTYKGHQGYMPLVGFLAEVGLCVHDEFREGNVSPSFGQQEFYRECTQRMAPGKRIGYYRADSASYQAGLINTLDRDGVKWAITADLDAAVKTLIGELPESAWAEPVAGCGYELAETVHSMEKTVCAFRLVVRREEPRQQDLFLQERYRYHAVATSWSVEEKSAQEVLAWHNQRGEAENEIKELKHGVGLERVPCGQSEANAVFFRIGVIAYNLFLGFKRLSCPTTWLRHTLATFRWKLFQLAGRIVHHAGRISLKLTVALEQLRLLRGIRKRVFAVRCVPAN
jgi:hypothetical protein